jgi:hypothetical protein
MDSSTFRMETGIPETSVPSITRRHIQSLCMLPQEGTFMIQETWKTCTHPEIRSYRLENDKRYATFETGAFYSR